LVEAAHELFMERDYDEVSIEEILDRSGVSRGALYHHFPSKRDLFRAVYTASEQRSIQLIAAGAAEAASPFEALLDAARRYLELSESDEEFRRIGLTQSRAVLGWEGWRAAASELGIGLATVLISAAIEAGELPELDPETTALVLIGALIEAAMQIAVAGDRAAARQRSEAVMVEMLEGLRR
jgi:AcrR family transcriptional regulator